MCGCLESVPQIIQLDTIPLNNKISIITHTNQKSLDQINDTQYQNGAVSSNYGVGIGSQGMGKQDVIVSRNSGSHKQQLMQNNIVNNKNQMTVYLSTNSCKCKQVLNGRSLRYQVVQQSQCMKFDFQQKRLQICQLHRKELEKALDEYSKYSKNVINSNNNTNIKMIDQPQIIINIEPVPNNVTNHQPSRNNTQNENLWEVTENMLKPRYKRPPSIFQAIINHNTFNNNLNQFQTKNLFDQLADYNQFKRTPTMQPTKNEQFADKGPASGQNRQWNREISKSTHYRPVLKYQSDNKEVQQQIKRRKQGQGIRKNNDTSFRANEIMMQKLYVQ